MNYQSPRPVQAPAPAKARRRGRSIFFGGIVLAAALGGYWYHTHQPAPRGSSAMTCR